MSLYIYRFISFCFFLAICIHCSVLWAAYSYENGIGTNTSSKNDVISSIRKRNCA